MENRAPLDPELLSRRRRRAGDRRARRGRRLGAAALALVLAIAVLAVVLDRGGPKPPVRSLLAPPAKTPQVPGRVRNGEKIREEAAVRHAIASVPFVSRGGREHREIALTFDDGPGPYTSRLAHILTRLHVRATFFQVGFMVAEFPKPAEALARDHQFVLGDHTRTHAVMGRLSPADQQVQVEDEAALASRAGVVRPQLFRPPYGSFTGATLRVVQRERMVMVLWSIDSVDYTRPGTQAIVHTVVSRARPGAIVLMHDGGGDRSQTIAALPLIVHRLRKRHYRLVTVPRLLADAPPPHRQKLPPGAGPG